MPTPLRCALPFGEQRSFDGQKAPRFVRIFALRKTIWIVDNRDRLYDDAIAAYGGALDRLAKGYESDPDLRQDLLQQVHVALWRSFASYDGRCSLRTWVYRVAHNTAASHVLRSRRASSRWVSLDNLETEPGFQDGQADADRAHSLSKLLNLIGGLKPQDRQTFLLYLEGETSESIAEITGLSTANVSTKLHRIRKLLIERFNQGVEHEPRKR